MTFTAVISETVERMQYKQGSRPPAFNNKNNFRLGNPIHIVPSIHSQGSESEELHSAY